MFSPHPLYHVSLPPLTWAIVRTVAMSTRNLKSEIAVYMRSILIDLSLRRIMATKSILWVQIILLWGAIITGLTLAAW